MAHHIDKTHKADPAATHSLPLSEQVAQKVLPHLISQYGPLYPVTNIDGTVDIYDGEGWLVASVTADGELEFLCHHEPPVEEHGVCDPEIQSCPDLPEAEQFTYYDPWNIDESWFTGGNPFEPESGGSQALANSTKKFADACEGYSIFDDCSGDDLPLYEAPLESQVLSQKTKEPEASDQEAAASVAGGEKPKDAGHAETYAGGGTGLVNTEPSGVIAPSLFADEQQLGAGTMVGGIIDLAIAAIGQATGATRLLTVDKHMPQAAGIMPEIQGTVEAAFASLASYVKQINASIGEALASAFQGVVCGIRRGIKGDANNQPAVAEAALHHPESGIPLEAVLPARAAAAGSAAPMPAIAGRGSAPLQAGAAALHDPACDPFSIALANINKGGPPYFITVTSAVATSPTAAHQSSNDRVLAARAHGDANHHHGEQEGDGRGQGQQEEYYPEAEIEADSEAFA